MPQACYSELFTKLKHCAFGENFTRLRKAAFFNNGEFHKVWSGASIVSYYDGPNLLGTEEVDEGEDVLHPSLDTTKEGYTLYGWRYTENDTERLESLLATGEPMTLQAYYLPNSILVARSYRYNTDTVRVDVWNTNYMSGSAYVQAVSTGNQDWGNGSFSINLGKYQTSTVKIWSYRYMVDDQGYGHDDSSAPITVDGVSRRTGDVLSNISGSHSMSCFAWTNWGNGERFVRMNGGLAEVTLSNPIAWE